MRSESGTWPAGLVASPPLQGCMLAASSSSWASTSDSCSDVSPYLALVSLCHSSFIAFVGFAAKRTQGHAHDVQKTERQIVSFEFGYQLSNLCMYKKEYFTPFRAQKRICPLTSRPDDQATFAFDISPLFIVCPDAVYVHL
jgi:hypothetical protein